MDEIFGTLRDYYISVKLNDDVKASSFTPKQKVSGGRLVVWEMEWGVFEAAVFLEWVVRYFFFQLLLRE